MLLRIASGAEGLVFATIAAEIPYIPTCTTSERRSGHLGRLALGMLSGVARGLLLLLGGLAVPLAMDVFLTLTVLILGTISICW